MAKPLPICADLIDCNYAVAGHDGTLSDIDGELFIKPCTDTEIAFYNDTIANHQDFYDFMPEFLGTLQLDENQNKSIEETAAELIAQHSIPEVSYPGRTNGKRIVTNQAVVLMNASHGFLKPNILDVKLGVRLWADDAHQEKKTRFDKVTEQTTHKDFGFRIAGMRVWQGPDAKGDDIDEDGYRIYNKDYGRFELNNGNVHEAFKNFIFTEAAGIDKELGQLISQAFLTDLRRIQDVLESQESRMYSASLLFVFEGDGKALRSAMEEASRTPPPTTMEHASSSSGETQSSFEEEEDEDEDDIEEGSFPKIYALKVIDFAHAQWTPGLGPDENALVGVRRVGEILEMLVES
ncbi:bf5bfc1c-9742-4a8f-a57c-22be3fa81c25 [Sclerotinia trifoliorum]|uniref:Kinase n=1 Tax=Sclerotinia trifoliorum TaxID=28548 RepID=A0A8H2W159_9HELO|nr:bf5bfc1c-9742-4a8f-a57c-22be3fa81c25 [Sclerotinia trifoliorum]